MASNSSPDVVVYVVWSSQVGGKERHVAQAAELIPDRRVRHFWDADQIVGTAFQPLLKTPEAAWDVWMLYDRGVRWQGEAPPRPDWWEHQLYRMSPERSLDPERFAKKAREMLERR